MSNADVLKSLKAGDIIRTTRTLKVTAPIAHCGPFVAIEAVDVGNAHQELTYFVDDSPTLKIEMVKKVAKQRTDYKVGDVVSGDELRATMWVRSTIVRNSCNEDFILLGNGRWRWARHLSSNPLDHWSYGDFGFDEFDEGPFELRYLP